MKTLLDQKIEQLSNLMTSHLEKHEEPGYDGSECEVVHKKIDHLREEMDLIKELFWFEVRNCITEDREEEGAGLAIRKDWKIVQIPEPSPSGIMVVSSLGFPFNF